MRSSALFFVLIGGCTVLAPRGEEPAPLSGEVLMDVAENPHRDEALALMDQHCGECHRPDSADAKPAALKVFALDDPHWVERLSDEQLESAFGRFDGKADEAGLATMRAFFDAELSLRGRPRR